MSPSVIIIDDDPDVTEVLSEFLRLRSIDVLSTGHDGKDAVELYKKHKPDVVIMDLTMPEYDGLYGVQNIRKLDPNARVVILTGSITYDAQKKLSDAGVSAIVEKPFGPNNLIEIIDMVSLGDTVKLKN